MLNYTNKIMMKENNKLIAEFMGYENVGTLSNPMYEYGERGGCRSLEDLCYHESWNWLMPVVQKIESLGYVFTIQGGKAEYGEMISETRCFIAEDKISSTYQAVVEFIKTYNNEE